MKKLIFFLSAVFVASPGYSQEMVEISSKEQAIEILRENECMQLFKWQEEDKAEGVELLIEKIGEIIEIRDSERNDLSADLLADTNGFLVHWSTYHKTASFAPSVFAILEGHFSSSDCQKLSERFSECCLEAMTAFDYLWNIQKMEEGWIVNAFGSTSEYIGDVYDYFGI